MRGLSLSQIAQTIMFAKHGVLNVEQLEMLAKFIPTSEEVWIPLLIFSSVIDNNIVIYKMEKITSHPDRAALGMPERYFLEVLDYYYY